MKKIKPTIDTLNEHLQKHNVKPSYQRIRILQYLTEKRNHPTVDEIYTELVREIPTLSKTTVYNTLNLFIDSNLIRIVTIDQKEARYDANTKDHGHFSCDVCGKIYDFSVDIDSIRSDDLNRFQIKEKDIYYRGICHDCR